jgi:DNA-binding MurR/RpiR family transcriptional regulator
LLPRYPRESIRLLEIARDLGFRIVCLTDGPGSPAGQYADQVLFAPVESSLVFDSHALPMTLSMVLLDAICTVDEEATQRRLEGFDRFASDTGLFI